MKMSKEKFTQGEWKAHLGIMEPTFVHIGKEDDYVDGETPVICELHHGIKKRRPDSVGFDFDHSEIRANAHLIAAAPEMYALLSIILSPTAMMSQQFRDERLRTAIENVLKKARGEA